MSLSYVKGSLKNVDKDEDGIADHLQFKMINYIGSGSAYVSDFKVLVDGEDMTDKATLKIAGQAPKPVKSLTYVTAYYGDEILVEIKHDGKIKPGLHRVELSARIEWYPISVKFEDTV